MVYINVNDYQFIVGHFYKRIFSLLKLYGDRKTRLKNYCIRTQNTVLLLSVLWPEKKEMLVDTHTRNSIDTIEIFDVRKPEEM